MAIRDSPIAAAAMGIDIALYKTLTFGVSALYTGVAGALGAIAVQFVAPDSFTFLLSISLLVGLVIGGVGSIPGSLVGGVFVLFVPNIAEAVSTGLAGRDLRRHHAAGHFRDAVRGRRFRAPRARLGNSQAASARANPERRSTMNDTDPPHDPRRAPGALALGAVAAPSPQKKYDTGASDTEIKIGNTNPYSGPASAYGVIGKTQTAFFTMINDQGGINGRKINFISYDDGYSPPKTVEQVRKLVESDGVLLLFNTLGTPTNTRDPQIHATRRRCRSSSSRPAPPNGATRSTSRGRWAGSRTTRAKGRSTRHTC